MAITLKTLTIKYLLSASITMAISLRFQIRVFIMESSDDKIALVLG